MLTALEACQYLRLDVGREDNSDAQLKALARLVERKLLRPTMYRHERMYRVKELDRFLEQVQRDD